MKIGLQAWEDQRVVAGMVAQLAARDRRRHAGARRLGWKLAFGTAAAQERWGIAGPVVGYLTDATLIANDSEVSIADWKAPRLEAEVAVRVAVDKSDPRVGSVGLAIELADLGSGSEDLAQVIGGDVYHRHTLLGPVDSPDTAIGPIRIGRDSEPVGVGECAVEVVGGSLAELVAYVASYLAAFDEEVRDGDVILTGSVVPPIPCEDGGSFAIFCDTLGSLAVSLRP